MAPVEGPVTEHPFDDKVVVHAQTGNAAEVVDSWTRTIVCAPRSGPSEPVSALLGPNDSGAARGVARFRTLPACHRSSTLRSSLA